MKMVNKNMCIIDSANSDVVNACFVIEKCEVCGSKELKTVLNLGMHPLCDDLVPVNNVAQCPKFPIEILYCSECDTAHQKYQVPKVQLFPRTYHYRSRFTKDVLSGMADLVDSIESQYGSLAGRTVLDIGCNDGSLLDLFASRGAKTIGVEPTAASFDAEGKGHFVVNDFFSEKTACNILQSYPCIDIITFTNVFAHIEDLASLLKALTLLVSENTIIVIENHYLGAVLEKNQFDTFYHEHPRTYTLHSFIEIAQNLSCEVVGFEFPKRYGGNIRVIIGKAGSATSDIATRINSVVVQESKFFEKFENLRLSLDEWKVKKNDEVRALIKHHGKICAKAFPGRAAILVELLGLSENEIECVYEKPGSLKIGHYLPGTRIPIRSDEELFERFDKISVLLNLAWHIPLEVELYLRNHGYKGQIVHIA
jgi:SAM-dependent methyltransferase